MVFSGILFHLKLALIRIYTVPAAQGLTLKTLNKFVKKSQPKGFFQPVIIINALVSSF